MPVPHIHLSYKPTIFEFCFETLCDYMFTCRLQRSSCGLGCRPFVGILASCEFFFRNHVLSQQGANGSLAPLEISLTNRSLANWWVKKKPEMDNPDWSKRTTSWFAVVLRWRKWGAACKASIVHHTTWLVLQTRACLVLAHDIDQCSEMRPEDRLAGAVPSESCNFLCLNAPCTVLIILNTFLCQACAFITYSTVRPESKCKCFCMFAMFPNQSYRCGRISSGQADAAATAIRALNGVYRPRSLFIIDGLQSWTFSFMAVTLQTVDPTLCVSEFHPFLPRFHNQFLCCLSSVFENDRIK